MRLGQGWFVVPVVFIIRLLVGGDYVMSVRTGVVRYPGAASEVVYGQLQQWLVAMLFREITRHAQDLLPLALSNFVFQEALRRRNNWC